MTNDDELLKRLDIYGEIYRGREIEPGLNDCELVSVTFLDECAARIRELEHECNAMRDIVLRYVDQTDEEHNEMMRKTVQRYKAINRPLQEVEWYSERIRELEAELELQLRSVEFVNKQLAEMDAELAFYKGFHDGVCKTGTHVIVPVEPTEAMELAAWNAPSGGLVKGIYRAMIRAAQEGNS